MDKVLGIYGAGGMGREFLDLSGQINERTPRWRERVFIDDGDLPPTVSGVPVYTYEAAREAFGADLEVCISVGEVSDREKLFGRLEADGIPTPSLIHPDVRIPPTTSVGRGVIIYPQNFISCDVTLEDYVFLMTRSVIAHDCVLERGCVIAALCVVAGACRVGRYAYVGQSSCLKQGISIGDHAIISMGSVVYQDIGSSLIALGNPARPMRRNEGGRIFK